jgi:hypothetical protein
VSTAAVALLDAASKKAWGYRSRVMAISAAEDILDAAPAADADAAYAVWCRAVGYDGPRAGLAKYLKAKYRNPGDIGISLSRAAVMAEKGTS